MEVPNVVRSLCRGPLQLTTDTLHVVVFTVMAGDVNLYFNDLDDDPSVAEIEVMVAEAASRRKGLAIHALAAIMLYGKVASRGGLCCRVTTFTPPHCNTLQLFNT